MAHAYTNTYQKSKQKTENRKQYGTLVYKYIPEVETENRKQYGTLVYKYISEVEAENRKQYDTLVYKYVHTRSRNRKQKTENSMTHSYTNTCSKYTNSV